MRKPVEQLPVERLVPQLVVDMSRILIGYAVIARLNLTCLLLRHLLVLQSWYKSGSTNLRNAKTRFSTPAVGVGSRCFLHHRLQRHVMLGCDPPAVFVLRGVIG